MKMFEILGGIENDKGFKLPDDWSMKTGILVGTYWLGNRSLLRIFDVKGGSALVSVVDLNPMGDDARCVSLIIEPISWETFVFSPYLFWSNQITRSEYESRYDQWESDTKKYLMSSFDEIKNATLNRRPRCGYCSGEHTDGDHGTSNKTGE